MFKTVLVVLGISSCFTIKKVRQDTRVQYELDGARSKLLAAYASHVQSRPPWRSDIHTGGDTSAARVMACFVVCWVAATAFISPPHAHRVTQPRSVSMMSIAGEGDVFRRAEFWEPDTCTLLDLANVLGRWDSASEWGTRSEFALVKAKRKEDMAQGATKKRFEMAQRIGVVERVALLQNVPKMPFRNAKLAAAFGRSVADFETMPVTKVALDVVFDALVESKSGLIKPELCDERRARWMTPEGGLDEGAIRAGLYRSRIVVLFSWLFFGKGRILSVAVGLKLIIDIADLKDELGALGPYVDQLLAAGAVVAAVVGVRNQASVAAATSDYKTVSAEEADAARLAEADDSNQYTTVFSKIGSKNTKSASQETSIKEKIMNVVSQPFLFPLIVALGGILSLNLIKQN